MKTDNLIEAIVENTQIRRERLMTDQSLLDLVITLQGVLGELEKQLEKQIELREKDKSIK